MFPAIYGKYKPQPHIRVHVKAEIGKTSSAQTERVTRDNLYSPRK